MTYTAQALNTRIEKQRSEGYRDDDGVWIQRWVTFGQAFALVEPLVGDQLFAAGQPMSNLPMKVTTRWRADYKPGIRLIVQGEAYNVESIQNIKFRNREVLMMVTNVL